VHRITTRWSPDAPSQTCRATAAFAPPAIDEQRAAEANASRSRSHRQRASLHGHHRGSVSRATIGAPPVRMASMK